MITGSECGPCVINPYLTNEFSNHYQLGESIFSSPEPLGSQGELIGWP